jgi:hypothetical protein
MTIIGYVISDEYGNYDERHLYTLADAKSIVRTENAARDEDEGRLAIGTVYEDGSVCF